MAHTPGPWKLREVTQLVYWGKIYTGTKSIAQVQLWEHGKASGDEEARANAHLIAAAPELLEALKGIANANQQDWDEALRSPEDFKRWAQSLANHVVNKAEGRQ